MLYVNIFFCFILSTCSLVLFTVCASYNTWLTSLLYLCSVGWGHRSFYSGMRMLVRTHWQWGIDVCLSMLILLYLFLLIQPLTVLCFLQWFRHQDAMVRSIWTSVLSGWQRDDLCYSIWLFFLFSVREFIVMYHTLCSMKYVPSIFHFSSN